MLNSSTAPHLTISIMVSPSGFQASCTSDQDAHLACRPSASIDVVMLFHAQHTHQLLRRPVQGLGPAGPAHGLAGVARRERAEPRARAQGLHDDVSATLILQHTSAYGTQC
jgi:hypothetical protein